MADSLFDILSVKDFSEPPEIAAIKSYIDEHFQASAEVAMRPFDIVITVASAPLAGVLRFHARKMQTAANTTKRLVIRIR